MSFGKLKEGFTRLTPKRLAPALLLVLLSSQSALAFNFQDNAGNTWSVASDLSLTTTSHGVMCSGKGRKVTCSGTPDLPGISLETIQKTMSAADVLQVVTDLNAAKNDAKTAEVGKSYEVTAGNTTIKLKVEKKGKLPSIMN